MSAIRILSAADVKALFTLPMAIEAVERAYLQKHTKQGGVWPLVFHEFDPGHADLDIKSGNLDAEGIFGLKLVSWFGANPDKGLPALYGTSLICDLATGRPKALLNAGPVTDLRTGAFVTPGDCFEQGRSMRIGYACEEDVLRAGLAAIDEYFALLDGEGK